MGSSLLIPSNCKKCKTGCFSRGNYNNFAKKNEKKRNLILTIAVPCTICRIFVELLYTSQVFVSFCNEGDQQRRSFFQIPRKGIDFPIANTSDYCCSLHALRPMSRLGKRNISAEGIREYREKSEQPKVTILAK